MEQQFSLSEVEEEVSLFLEVFHKFKALYGIVFYEPEINLQALLELEMSPYTRERVIDLIRPVDYCGGPFYWNHDSVIECWRFIKQYKAQKIQIAISLGLAEEPVRCYSFGMV